MASVTEVADKMKETIFGSAPGFADDDDSPSSASDIFLTHAIKDSEDGELYMTEKEFVDAIAPPDEDYHKIKRDYYGLLFGAVDRQKNGRISLHDWNVYHNLLAKPDAEYLIAFRLFANVSSGAVNFEDFRVEYMRNKTSVPFDWDGGWAKLYVGGKKHRHTLTYPQFAQMLRGLQGERVRQLFLHYDTDNDGYIEPEDFQRIIVETSSHKLSDHLLDNLPTLCNISSGSQISYANVRAFLNVIREMDLVERIVQDAIAHSEDGKITRVDFLNQAASSARFALYTPMEADILFHFASLDQPSGRLGMEDFVRVLDPSWTSRSGFTNATDGMTPGEKAAADSDSFLHNVLVSAHHFALGSIAGAFGAFMVYPIDLVKTRMQNQRSARVGQLLYKNSIDCFQKVIRNEGVRGLYSGVLPQLVGVAPEKAIKLTVNDLLRGKLGDSKTGNISLASEIISGGSAGACQVVFTNPLEIVKIRLQVQGEAAKAASREGEEFTKRSALWIVRNLGLKGLYKGASACLLRDVPFSAIYFPTYSHLKKDYFGESPTKKLGILQLLTAGAIAGMPAAYLTTPCDVIKTRLQVEARKGDTSYTGLRDAATKVWKEEGFRAFFKGGPARILRSSPQFGFTLAGYELLQALLPLPGSGSNEPKPRGGFDSPSDKKSPLPYLRSRNALKIILDLDIGFGKVRRLNPAAPEQAAGTGVFGAKRPVAASPDPKA